MSLKVVEVSEQEIRFMVTADLYCSNYLVLWCVGSKWESFGCFICSQWIFDYSLLFTLEKGRKWITKQLMFTFLGQSYRHTQSHGK
jgi:hypothetical protein